MQEQMTLEVEAREERGKNAARRLRAAGKVPATIYGLDQEPTAIAIDTKTITRILARIELRNRVLNLSGGASGTAMAVDYQLDPVSGALLHVDVRRVAADTPVRASIPIESVGISQGVKTEGGLEDRILRVVEVEALPGLLPVKIEINVEPMQTGESIRVSDLEMPEGVRATSPASATVLRIVGKRGLEELEEEEVGEDAEAAEGEETAEAAPADE